MNQSQNPTKPVMALSAFTDNTQVKAVLSQLHQKFGNTNNPTPNMDNLIVSDTLDDQGNQYVHLVQEGGGVLGVALVGYTYILEKAGIRFMRLAGTSAGAINTAMMAVIGKKEDAKSEKVLNYLCNKDLFDFVDGHPFARKVIRKLITQEHYFKNVKKLITATAIAMAVLLMLNIICIGLKDNPVFALIGKFSFVFTGMLVVSVLVGLGYFNMLLKRFKDRGFGINPGKDFQDWVRDIMQEHNVTTVSDFIEKAGTVPQGLHLRNGGSLKDLGPDVTLITSDIVTQNKIEFPKMWDLFTTDEKTLHPAQFVRASMSIPIFFESSIIQDIPRNEAAIQQSWMKHLMTDPGDVPSAVRFVDGGILSNFPINIFYNPKIEVPRLPTFGIDLDDVAPEDKEKSRQNTGKMGLGGYMGRMFNTIRYYYDKDFLLKNSLFKKGIGRIDVHEFNWLDFSISDEKKVALFVKGAEAAGQFLQGFDWEAYKADRREAFDKLNKVKPIQQSLTTAAV